MKRYGFLQKTGLASFLIAVPVSLALVGGFLGWVHPAFDFLAHFRIHLAVALIILSLALLITPRFRLNGLLAAILGVGAILDATGTSIISGPAPVQASQQPREEHAPVYRLMQLNLRFDNPEPDRVLSLIGRVRPDVVALEEMSSMWVEKLEPLETAYPYRLFCQVDGAVGDVAILSLRPFADASRKKCLPDGTFGAATFDFGGFPVEVAAMHLHRPWPFPQLQQIRSLIPTLADFTENAILAGDLNATPWSFASATVGEAAAMTPIGPAKATWIWHGLPDWMRFAGLPIDRVFARGDIIAQSIQTLEPVGSDHLPVLLEFSPKIRENDDQSHATALAMTP